MMTDAERERFRRRFQAQLDAQHWCHQLPRCQACEAKLERAAALFASIRLRRARDARRRQS